MPVPFPTHEKELNEFIELKPRHAPWLCVKGDLDKLVEFYSRHLATHSPRIIRRHLIKHLEYHTVDYVKNENGEIIGLCRWNIDEDTCRVIDLAIDEHYRNQGIGKLILEHGLKLWNKVKYLEFERQQKNHKERRKIPIEAILNHNFF